VNLPEIKDGERIIIDAAPQYPFILAWCESMLRLTEADALDTETLARKMQELKAMFRHYGLEVNHETE
jgi:hypothetical protein